MRVGLLEDDESIQEMLVLLLQDEGYSVTTYADHNACLQALDIPNRMSYQSQLVDPPIDIMILDWRLNGELLGTDIIQLIRRNARLHKLPIILMTAASPEDINELHKVQAVILEKPFSIDEMSTLIKTLIAS
jgi:DNA-binding response OmpR family regulator